MMYVHDNYRQAPMPKDVHLVEQEVTSIGECERMLTWKKVCEWGEQQLQKYLRHAQKVSSSNP
jgi:hypothetical protein